MSALNRLRERLSFSEESVRPMTENREIDSVIHLLRRRVGAGGTGTVPEDLQIKAVRQFWRSSAVGDFKMARFLAFGLGLPVTQDGPTILADTERFSAALTAFDQWIRRPTLFRRCYQGLVSTYFMCDVRDASATPETRANWEALRTYLADRVKNLQDGKELPNWVRCILENAELFSGRPCDRYAAATLDGDTSALDALRTELKIADSSWFVRELVFSQVRHACSRSDAEFLKCLPRLLDIIDQNDILRDAALTVVLDRYAAGASLPLHQRLRECTVSHWGNPWLESNAMRWGSVGTTARAMVSDWLKLEFIESFFTLLAEDGESDSRRLNFWKQYVDQIDDIHFALGSNALSSRDKDFVSLRRKIRGISVVLADGPASNNAFIMSMKEFVIVEFSGRANALYVYGGRHAATFDLSRPVFGAKNARNSLKSSARLLWLKHQDAMNGHATWEQAFAERLRDVCGIVPSRALRRARQTALPASRTGSERVPSAGLSPAASYRAGSAQSDSPVPASNADRRDAQAGAQELALDFGRTPAFSDVAFLSFTSQYRLKVVDRRASGGNLWVREENLARDLSKVLERWGFKFKATRGWWK